MLHGKIIRMRVDLQIFAKCKAMGKAKGCHTAAMTSNGNTVDHAVRAVVEPRTVKDLTIGWILTLKIAEYPKYFAVLGAKIKLSPFNIRLQKLP